MRVRLHISNVNGSQIPVDYHYLLSSWIYSAIRGGNEEIATYLHYQKDIKPYTFSELYLRGDVNGEMLHVKSDDGSIIFSSHRSDVVEAFVKGVLEEPVLKIGDEKMEISQVEVLKEPEFSNIMTFKTLSPIVVSVSRAEARVNKKRYLYPVDPRWYVNLEKNMKRRYRKFLGEEYSGKLEIEVVKYAKPKRYNIKGTYVRASKLTFRVRGDPEIIKINYQSGFGERTAQGFGCVEIKN